MQRSPLLFSRSVGFLAIVLLVAHGCTAAGTRTPAGSDQDAAGPSSSGSGGDTGSSGSGGTTASHPDAAAVGTSCNGLTCQQTTCTGPGCTAPPCMGPSARTSLSGIVYDPAGKVPLYNVSVYIPNSTLPPLAEGATCDRCDTAIPGHPIATSQTDAKGAFFLDNPPVGNDIPLVIQIGKWRRELKVPVMGCVQNVITDKNVTRLPRNQSEGHIPKIALTTGGADAMECLLRKIGLEDSEFTPEAGTGRVNFFSGVGGTAAYVPTLNAGAAFTDAATWWELKANLMKYDLVLHSCEGTERPVNKSIAARQALLDYLNAGGRVFASHWHNYWLEFGAPPLPTTAVFNHQGALDMITSTIDTSFPKGNALADWLLNVGGSTVRGQLPIAGAKHTVDAVNPMVSQRWIYLDLPVSVQYFTSNTPIGVPAIQQCGRVVFSDIHVSSGVGDQSGPGFPFPMGCLTQDLSPQEKALEFMLFDLSSCIMPDKPIP
ncbi:MAG TPA: carboxypeptidase regulatory-like domain-containing protein [Polyangia bacterium]|nr:carboxypeptidase regulatory-like domain-containing protein [Polyangia bacterium]